MIYAADRIGDRALGWLDGIVFVEGMTRAEAEHLISAPVRVLTLADEGGTALAVQGTDAWVRTALQAAGFMVVDVAPPETSPEARGRAREVRFNPYHDEKGRFTHGPGGGADTAEINRHIWERGAEKGRPGVALGEADVEALKQDLLDHPHPPPPLTPAARIALRTVEEGLVAWTTGRNRQERGFFIAPDGRNLGEVAGDRQEIFSMPRDPDGKYADSVFTHSHPDSEDLVDYGTRYANSVGGTFSPNDLMTAMIYRLSEIRAVDSESTYSLRAPASGWNAASWIENRDWFDRVEYVRMMRGGTRAEQIAHMDEFWQNYAEETGTTYTVTRHAS